MTLFMFVCAFCAGVIGALAGAFQACMLGGIIGVLSVLFPSSPLFGTLLSNGFIPYVAFTGAVAATAYAAKVRKHDLGGAAILTSLNKFNDISVLLVSGVVAAISLAFVTWLSKSGLPIDMGSVSVIVISCLVRIFLGDGKFLNRKFKELPRYSTNKLEWLYIFFLGALGGFMAGYIGESTGNVWIPFYISLASLIFYFLEPNFPPSHHISCTAAYAYMATGSIAAAAIWGAIAQCCMVFIGDTINTDSSTHIDPPATTIGILSIIIWLIYYVIL